MVEIRGGGPLDGAILVDAASDSTLNRLIDTLTMQGNAAKAEKVNQLAQTVKSPEIDAATESFKKLTKVSDSHHESTDKLQKKFDDFGKNLGTVSATLASKGITSIFDFFNTGLDSFRTLSNVGSGFNGNLTELSATAMRAGLSVENFSKLVMSNSGSLVGMGSSAEEGARKLAQVSDSLTKSDITRRFTSMGMTVGDINSTLTAYLDMQGRLGNLTKLSTTQIQQGTAQFAEEMDRVTRTLGTNRQELMDAVSKNSLDPVLRQINANIRDAGGNVEKALANQATLVTTGGESLKQAFLQVATGMPKDDMSRALMQFGQLTIEDARKYLKGELGPEALGNLATNLKQKLSGLNEAYVQAVPIYREASTALLSLGKYADANFVTQQKLDADRNTALNSFGSKLGDFGMGLANAYQKLKAFFIDSPIFRSIEGGLNDAIGVLKSESFTNALKNFGGVLSREFENFVNEVKKGYQNGTVWNGIMAGLSSLWASLTGPIAAGIGELFRTLFPKVFANIPTSAGGDDNKKAGEGQLKDQTKTFDIVIDNIKNKAKLFFEDLPTALSDGLVNASGAFGFLFGKIDAFIDSLPSKLKRVKTDINSFLTGISLNPINDMSASLAPITTSMGSIERIMGGLSSKIENVKSSITGFSTTVINEMTRLEEYVKPGGSMQTTIGSFSTSLAEIQGPIGSLIKTLSGQSGSTAQTISSSAISSVVNSLSGFIEKTSQAIQSIENVNPEKIQQIIPILSQLGQSIRSMFTPSSGSTGSISDFASKMSGTEDSIGKISRVLQSAENINPEKIQQLTPVLSQLGQGMRSLFIPLGEDFISKVSESEIAIDKTISTVGKLQNLANINLEKIQQVMPILGQVGQGMRSFFIPLGGDFISKIGEAEATVDKAVVVLGKLQNAGNVNLEKVQQLMPILGQIGQGMRSFFIPLNSDFASKITGTEDTVDKASRLFEKLQNINVNPEKIQQIVPILGQVGQGMRSLFAPAAGGTVSDFITRLVGSEVAIDRAVSVLGKFEGLNSGNLQSVVTSMGGLKGLGVSLGSDVEGVRTFTSEVNSLKMSLASCAADAERLKAAAGSLPNGYSSASNVGGSGSGGSGFAAQDVYTELKTLSSVMRTATSLLASISENTTKALRSA